MQFEKYKKVFDKSFGKVTPDEFIKEIKKLGYKFKKIKKNVKPYCPDCKSTNIFFYGEAGSKVGSCKDCFTEWDK